jgi:hypothetical protein
MTMPVRPTAKLVIAASLLAIPLVGCTGSTDPGLTAAPAYTPPQAPPPPPPEIVKKGQQYGQNKKYQEAMERSFGGGAK